MCHVNIVVKIYCFVWIRSEIKKKKIRRENRKYRNRFTKKIEIEEKNDVLFE